MSHPSASIPVSESPPARRQQLSPLLVVVVAAAALVAAAVLAVVLLLPGHGSSAGSEAPLAGSQPRDEVATMRAQMKLLRRQVQTMAQQQGKVLQQVGPKAAVLPAPTEQEVSARDRQRFEGLAHKYSGVHSYRTDEP